MDEITSDIGTQQVAVEQLTANFKETMVQVAGFCHALGQPATVLLSSMELLKMEGIDDETRTQVVDMCYEAVLELKSLLAEMKQKREYVAHVYLAENGIPSAEWAGKEMPKGSWEK